MQRQPRNPLHQRPRPHLRLWQRQRRQRWQPWQRRARCFNWWMARYHLVNWQFAMENHDFKKVNQLFQFLWAMFYGCISLPDAKLFPKFWLILKMIQYVSTENLSDMLDAFEIWVYLNLINIYIPGNWWLIIVPPYLHVHFWVHAPCQEEVNQLREELPPGGFIPLGDWQIAMVRKSPQLSHL